MATGIEFFMVWARSEAPRRVSVVEYNERASELYPGRFCRWITVPSYSRLFLEALALVFVTHCVASPYLEFLKRKCCWSEERTCRPFQSNACL